jgi:hypothetical protein
MSRVGRRRLRALAVRRRCAVLRIQQDGDDQRQRGSDIVAAFALHLSPRILVCRVADLDGSTQAVDAPDDTYADRDRSGAARGVSPNQDFFAERSATRTLGRSPIIELQELGAKCSGRAEQYGAQNRTGQAVREAPR